MDGSSPHNHRAPSQSIEGVCAIPREGSSAPGRVAQPRRLRMVSKGLLQCQHPLGIPSDHITSVINSIIGFSFAETARSRWAPSAPCMGLAAGGGDKAPPSREMCHFCQQGTRTRPHRGAAAAPGQWLWVQLPSSPSPFTTHQALPTNLLPLGIHQPQTRLHRLR